MSPFGSAWQRHCFVTPDLEGPYTGGTLFNRYLTTALRESGQEVLACDIASVHDSIVDAPPTCLWIDSLLMQDLPDLIPLKRYGHVLGLLVHYLPSLVGAPTEIARARLSTVEQTALEIADAYLVTSRAMSDTLRLLDVSGRPVLVLEPGQFSLGLADPVAPRCSVWAIIVANVTPGKGILPLLEELARFTRPDDEYRLDVLGSLELDSTYAQACEKGIESHPGLASRVRLVGARSPHEAARAIADADLLVSSSLSESYGMALAEARTLGVPILALAGGNVAQLVDVSAGGELASTHRELTEAFLRLCRNPRVIRDRRAAARAQALLPRSWARVARDFAALVQLK